MSSAQVNNTNFQQILQNKLCEIREKNPQFSGRAFAKRMGVSPGALSEILNGQRWVTRKMALRFCERLSFDPLETVQVLKHYPTPKEITKQSSESISSLKLSQDTFKMMSEWQHFAVLSFMNTAHFKPDCQYISERMGISQRCVEQTVETLVRLGLIVVEADGNWARKHAAHRTSDGVKDASIRKSHIEGLDLARQAMDKGNFHETDFTAMTFPLDQEDLPEAKLRIRKFQQELFEEFNRMKKPKEVYRLSMQLYPLTRSAPVRKNT